MRLLDLLTGALGAAQRHGLSPFSLAFVVVTPAALVATAIEHWLELPGSLLLVGLLMAAFFVYVAAITPLLIDNEAAARQRSVSAAIDRADASMVAVLLAGAATGVLVAAALELRLLPGFLVLGLLALTAPAIVRERRGPLAALRRGLSLTQGNALAFAALGAIVGAASTAVYAALAFVLDPLPVFLGELVAVSVTATLAAPVAAHVFVQAFDGRARGRRLAVTPTANGKRHSASSLGRAALGRTLGSLGHSRTRQAPRVSFTAAAKPDASTLRYSPDVATQTHRVVGRSAEPTSLPEWAQTVDEATVEELQSAV